MRTAAELIEALNDLPRDGEVPAHLLLSALPRHLDLSYIETALDQWRQTATLYGRDVHPEVDAFLAAVYDVL